MKKGFMIQEIRVISAKKGAKIKTARVYRVEGVDEEQAEQLAKKLFCDAIDQKYCLNKPILDGPVVEVAYKPGVMNPETASIMKAASDLGIRLLAADSSTEYRIGEKPFVNKIVERIVSEKPKTLIIAGYRGSIEIVPICKATAEELMALSKDKLFLDLAEMKIIQEYFRKLKRDPTDCELEIIAARWSEHCGHKTFKAKVIADGVEKSPLFTRISETAKKYFGEEIISAFEDNSGVIKFYDGLAICGKVETHNSPSAIEPYGGAMTGSGGVFRDIMGTGQGAKVIASTDIFCFAPPDLDPSMLPRGTLSPDYLRKRVVEGVRDYGNRMGIPTNNGSVHYDKDFRAKPTIIVGAYGIIPKSMARKGKPEVNDLVVVMGGRTGRDGIHGATFSSGEMTDRTINVNSSTVQIGNAIEEKKMADAIIEARDKNLIRAITDCGAAGFSSAIGEMGEEIGVTVDISNAPVKYPGLAPWEIWLSESQERMVVAVAPKKLKDFLEVCKKYNVEAIVLGQFNKSSKLTVKFDKETVAELDYDFLKYGLGQRMVKAKNEEFRFDETVPKVPIDWKLTIKKVLAHGNVCSKEGIVRQYDHGVQGTNALAPFGGKNFDGPNDAVVLTPILGKKYGVVVSHGINPILNRIDPYWGSVWAFAEGMANFVAVGGDPKCAAIINNYIWPYPDEETMGSLDLSVDAVVDCMKVFKRPVISGKDSLSSTYRGNNGEIIKIPPVLCISVFGKIPDIKKTVTSDIKKPGSFLYLVGAIDNNLGGSIYYDVNGLVGGEIPKVDLKNLPKVFKRIHQAIKGGKILACHDVSEGGIITTVLEMAFGGDCGVELNLPEELLFNETVGVFVVEVKDKRTAQKIFKNISYRELGRTTQKKEVLNISVDELKKVWKEGKI